jgi:hypothetical protein
MSDGTRIEAFLAELERRLGRARRDGGRVVAEVREHLLDAAADEQRRGRSPAEAERLALQRFGSARRLARSLGARSPLTRVGRVGALAAVLAGGASLAFASTLDTPPVVGFVQQSHTVKTKKGNLITVLGAARLARLDPKTLKPVGPTVRTPGAFYVGGGLWSAVAFNVFSYPFAVASPDGRRLAFNDRGALVIFDAQRPRQLARVHVVPPPPESGPHARSQRGGSADDIRAAAWLGKNVAVTFVQHLAPPYARRVTGRWIVRLDLARRRVLSRTRVQVEGGVGQSVSGGGWLVVPVCQGRRLQLVAADAAGHVKVLRPAASCAATPVLGRGGDLVLLGPGRTLVRVSLPTGRTSRVRLDGTCAALLSAPTLGVTWAGNRLAVVASAARIVARHLPGLGACLVDPATGTTTRLTADGSSLLVTGDRIVVSGLTRNVRGAGLTAFSLSGQRVWHAAGDRVGQAFAIGDRVFLPRLVKGATVVESYDLRSGRALATIRARGLGLAPLSGAVVSVG